MSPALRHKLDLHFVYTGKLRVIFEPSIHNYTRRIYFHSENPEMSSGCLLPTSRRSVSTYVSAGHPSDGR